LHGAPKSPDGEGLAPSLETTVQRKHQQGMGGGWQMLESSVNRLIQRQA
jgi:hypothetical protein